MREIGGWALVVLQGVLLVALVIAPRTELSPARGILGLLLLLSAVALGLIAGMRLGSALTPTPVPITGSALRTTGPYRWVRHPIYSAVLLGAMGFAVAVGTVWTWLIVVILAVFFTLKARWEDSLLLQTHGEQWRQWAQYTGALIPRLSRRT